MVDYRDIRSTGDSQSIIRQLFSDFSQISLNSFPYKFNYDNFTRKKFYFSQRGFTDDERKLHNQDERKKILEEVIEEMPDFIPNCKVFRGSLNELLRNAFEHGNQENVSKAVGVGWKYDSSKLQVFVEDEGGFVHSQFIPYILRIEQALNEGEDLKGFYEFIDKPLPNGHSGSGLKSLSYYFDSLSFYKSDLNGLLVQGIKNF